MARPLKPVDDSQVAAAELGLQRLREARDLFKAAGAERTLGRIQLAITSAGGAIRHAQRRRHAQ